jgi:dolichol-phosphate mannosyltransferase
MMLLDAVCALVLGAFGATAVIRMARGIRATRIAPVAVPATARSISVIVPVLDEAARIERCLHGLRAAGAEVGEILVVDGGSRDGTLDCVRRAAANDARVRIIDASPVPVGWNGKAWGLDVGLRAADPQAHWIATVDADVIPTGGLFSAMAAHARARNVAALSVAARQLLGTPLMAIVHPAMLATLVYRFGLPGREATRVADVQASGQCFLAERALLIAHGAFANVRASRCEDVTLARSLVAAGTPVGFYEAGDLVSVQMYADARETWRNWPRSLTLRDRFAPFGGWAGLTEVALVQAAPLPLVVGLAFAHAGATLTFAVAAMLVCVRIGVLCGAARAYVQRPWSYWFSPLADVPATVALFASALRRRHTWRGRELILAEPQR